LLHQFPSSVTAGLSIKAEVHVDAYPAPEWTLTAIIRGPSSIDLEAAPLGSGHLFAETAAVTSGWDAGTYAVSVRAVSGEDVHEVEAGQLTIAADLVSVHAGFEARGHAQRVLASIEAVIEGRATKDQESYAINGRSLVRTSIADLMLLRDRYKREIARESPNGKRRRLTGRQVKVRFGR
tara:strand:+ start:21775 stop:22314 length:540 start_codon:yes stop_codon:yes gene_type:complete